MVELVSLCVCIYIYIYIYIHMTEQADCHIINNKTNCFCFITYEHTTMLMMSLLTEIVLECVLQHK